MHHASNSIAQPHLQRILQTSFLQHNTHTWFLHCLLKPGKKDTRSELTNHLVLKVSPKINDLQ